MESSPEMTKAVFIAGLIFANFAAIIGSYVSIKVSIAKLEVRQEVMEKDIGRLGMVLGTQRAKGQKEEQ